MRVTLDKQSQLDAFSFNTRYSNELMTSNFTAINDELFRYVDYLKKDPEKLQHFKATLFKNAGTAIDLLIEEGSECIAVDAFIRRASVHLCKDQINFTTMQVRQMFIRVFETLIEEDESLTALRELCQSLELPMPE